MRGTARPLSSTNYCAQFRDTLRVPGIEENDWHAMSPVRRWAHTIDTVASTSHATSLYIACAALLGPTRRDTEL